MHFIRTKTNKRILRLSNQLFLYLTYQYTKQQTNVQPMQNKHYKTTITNNNKDILFHSAILSNKSTNKHTECRRKGKQGIDLNEATPPPKKKES
jgi:hypothetical protein